MLWHGIYFLKAQSTGDKPNCVSRCVIVPGILLPEAINVVKSYIHKSRKGELTLKIRVYNEVTLWAYY